MRKIKILKPHKDYKVGEIVQVGNNEAWGMVEAGIATYDIKVVQKRKTKELRPKKTKGYKIKNID